VKKHLLAVIIMVSLLSACGGGEQTTNTPEAAASPMETPALAATVLPTHTPVPPAEISASTETAIPLPTETDLSTSTPVPLRPSGSSGSGVLAFYSERDGNPEIYVMNADGSEQRRLTFNQFEDSSPDRSPDGRQIAFISDRDDPQAGQCFPDCMYQLYLINADGSGEHKFLETEFRTLHPDWHPDGTRLSFDTESNLQGDVYVVNADGSGLQRLIVDGFWADWSPDGSQIVFASRRDGNVEIYVADADGRNQRRLTENRQLDYFPAWSPDGRRIAFARVENKQIYVMNADGSHEQQLTHQLNAENPSWSPDGTRIAFQSSQDGDFEIYTIDVDDAIQGGEGAGPTQLTDNQAGDLWPSWGPARAPEPGARLSFDKSAQTFASVPTYQIGLDDLDGDGDLDAVFSNGQANDSQVWLNEGGGVFSDSGQQLGKYGHGVNVGDLDGDGDPDLLINTHRDSAPSRVYLNDGNALFQEREGAFKVNIGFNVYLFDLDGDGDLDAVGEAASEASAYLNDGTGAFSVSEITFPLTTVWGDLDADGDVDVLVKQNGVGYAVHLNDGLGRFHQHWTQADAAAMDMGDMALGDVDDDGGLDAVITNGHFQSSGLPVMIFLNDGTGRFTDSGQRLNAVKNASVSLGDLDGDGDPDLVLTDYMEPCQIWLNDGSGQFMDSGFRFGDDQFYRHVHLGDLDGDGDLDIFLAAFGVGQGPNEIWFNTTPRGESAQPEENGLYLGQEPPGLDVEVFAPGIVSIEEGKEYKIAFSPDLQEIFFTRRTPGGRNDRLWTSRLENGKLTVPQMAPFTYDVLETDACFSPDGNRLYFNSARPLPGEKTASRSPNVWFVDRTEGGWGEPRFLDSPLNDYQPVYFSIANDGTLYFTRSSPRGIYYAEPMDGQYLEAKRLPDEINDLREVAHPAVAPDESYIIVDSAYEQGGRLVGSLYVSFKQPDGSWTKAASMHNALGASDADVYAIPRITPDGKYLFFEKYEAETDRSDIYWVSTAVIEGLRSH
jgi:Tol biopolymer transport system component